MNLILNRLPQKFFTKLVISLVIFVLCLTTLTPPIKAQTQPSSLFQNTQSLDTSPATSDRQTVTTPTGSESGRVLQFGLGDLLDAVFGGLKSFFNWVGDQLWGLIMKISAGILHMVAAVFGSDTSQACANSNDEQCVAAIEQLAKIDPFFSPEYSSVLSDVNIFTLADDSYSTLYASLPEASFVDEVTYLARDTLLGATPALAQETDGEKDLGDLIRGLWQKMRDISYIASVLVLVIIGFMVMLRRRLDPKTVVTATNSLPRVVIGLILITFSFAISSLFVDAIHLLVELTRNYLGDLPGLAGPLASAAQKFGGEFLWLPFFTLISESVIGWGTFVRLLYPVLLGAAFAGGVPGLLVFIPIIAALLFDIIIRIGLFILAIMLFWSLLVRYATLVMLTVFSPFFFLAGMVPGFEGVTMTWFRRMLSVVISFPAILVIAYLALALLSPNSGSGIGAPPPLGTSAGILNISALVGLGVLYFAHKIPAVIDDVLGIKDTKQKGLSPLLLASGALAGAQTASSINKAAPMLGGWAAGMAGTRGGVGFAARGLSNVMGIFNPDVNSPVRDAAGQTRVFTKEHFTGKGKTPSDFGAKEFQTQSGETRYVMSKANYARYQRHESDFQRKTPPTQPREVPLHGDREDEADFSNPNPTTPPPTGTPKPDRNPNT